MRLSELEMIARLRDGRPPLPDAERSASGFARSYPAEAQQLRPRAGARLPRRSASAGRLAPSSRPSRSVHDAQDGALRLDTGSNSPALLSGVGDAARLPVEPQQQQQPQPRECGPLLRPGGQSRFPTAAEMPTAALASQLPTLQAALALLPPRSPTHRKLQARIANFARELSRRGVTLRA